MPYGTSPYGRGPIFIAITMEAHGNYKPGYDSAYDTAKNETTSDDHHHGSGSVEKEGKNDDYKISSYTKMNCPPSKQMRQPLSSSSSQRSTRRLPSYNNKIVQESANNCINSRFDHDTFSTAKSMALKFANPCGLDMNQYNNNYCPPPRTPSTVGSSFSDDESVETSSSLAQHSSHPKRNNLKSRCSDDNRSGHPFLRRTVIQRRSSRSSEAYSQFSTEKDEGGYPPLTRGIAPNFDKNDGEETVNDNNNTSATTTGTNGHDHNYDGGGGGCGGEGDDDEWPIMCYIL